VQVKKLVVSSFDAIGTITKKPIKPTAKSSPRACRWIRQRVLSNLADTGSEKLSFHQRFFTRRKALTRRIINEYEVIEALATFVAYALEEMSFSEQVRLFSQAEILLHLTVLG